MEFFFIQLWEGIGIGLLCMMRKRKEVCDPSAVALFFAGARACLMLSDAVELLVISTAAADAFLGVFGLTAHSNYGTTDDPSFPAFPVQHSVPSSVFSLEDARLSRSNEV